ncbi:aminotransferase class I/II-fold pyridoxal phosphate-dependent enzyme, partial [Candidatus Dependentiae bacterium]|nr:aminotransferase class I/II-fold pyridoxal phosphate-dependent enzyme [Candidatus Dependentiae bacterium]
MYKINFDKVINRKNTNCSKWDNAKKRLNADIDLPLWVADMDFQSPPEVIKTLCKYAAHGIYGYTYIPDEYYKTIIEWNRKKHFWDIPQEHILFSPGVVISLKTLVQAFTKPGDNIIIQSPIYPPFYSSISSNERRILVNPLIIRDGRYHIDFNDFEKKIKDKKTTMFLL